jgi:DNA-binding Lrp family transcriptional regulator
MPVAQQVADLKRLGLPQREIARRVGVSPQRVHQILTGYQSPVPEAIARRLLPLLTREPRLTYKQIARKIGIEVWMVRQYAQVLYNTGRYAGRYRRKAT